MGPAMIALAGVKPATGPRAGEGRLSWPVLLLMLAAVTSSSLSALSLHRVMALQAEVEVLKSEVFRRREEGKEAARGGQIENINSRRDRQEPLHPPDPNLLRKKRMVSEPETVFQPCLQLLANNSRKIFRKDFERKPHIAIPWQAGLWRGTALEADEDSIVVREGGFFFVYSQVYYYMDSTFAMGHVVIRRKRTVVGNEASSVTLFRCVQNMNPVYPFNTCYTGGIVKLEVGDRLELLIPRSTANLNLDGDGTFLGAVKLL